MPIARRVYYILLATILAALAVSPAFASPEGRGLAVDASMVRGEPSAPVTIFEFSDYQ